MFRLWFVILWCVIGGRDVRSSVRRVLRLRLGRRFRVFVFRGRRSMMFLFVLLLRSGMIVSRLRLWWTDLRGGCLILLRTVIRRGGRRSGLGRLVLGR